MELSRTSVAIALAAATWGTAAALAQSLDEWVVPAAARGIVNALSPGNPEHVRRGRSLFVKHCVTCHGEQGRGDGPSARLHARRSGYAPRDLSRPEVQAGLTDGEMFWKIGAGWRPGGRIVMPGVGSELSEEDRWRLVVYVRSLEDKGGTR
jgi:mono/diheme cytochrome c family protein